MKFNGFLPKSIFIALLGLLWQPFALSYQFLAAVDGEQWRWISAKSHLHEGVNYVVSSLWDIPFGHPAAKEVILGGIQHSPTTIDLHFEGSIYKLPIKVEGVEYRLANIQSVSQENGAQNRARTSEVATGVAEVAVIGSGLGNKKITLNKAQSSFQAFRPIINADINNWIAILKRNNAQPGKYTGTVLASVVYDYIRNGTRMSYSFRMPIQVIFDFSPVYFNKINVIGDGEMQVKVDPNTGEMSGETFYQINATGYFNNLFMGLRKSGERFLLNNVNDLTGEKAIPYHVYCSNCTENLEIITDGYGQINETEKLARMESANSSSASAQIKVSFEPVGPHGYMGETFTGNFTLMFFVDI